MENQRKWRTWTGIIATAVLLSAIGFYSTAKADTASTPGTADDPIVTKGYVDQKVAELVKVELDKLGPLNGGNTGNAGDAATGMAPIEVVTVPLGKSIIVKAGGELIVRAGTAVAVSTDTNGLSDMTDGVDIAPGKRVGNNHFILFPRDGRGVKHDPKSKAELIVLVRGGYELK
ncbi:hypothetical protein [Cohnella candidum]|uniref:hypothetical protein n=1 Tax=Cohnella candidum TaxID=2674991 RepID=UPI001F1502B4|nr:hypothetical protein [Cohnella candidum]